MQAVDELYHLCEAENSLTHCAEAAALLTHCSRDFTKLAERLQEQTSFEESPTKGGLAWEVRKTTAGASPPPADVSLLHDAMARMGIPKNSKWLRPPLLVPDALDTQQLQTASPSPSSVTGGAHSSHYVLCPLIASVSVHQCYADCG